MFLRVRNQPVRSRSQFCGTVCNMWHAAYDTWLNIKKICKQEKNICKLKICKKKMHYLTFNMQYGIWHRTRLELFVQSWVLTQNYSFWRSNKCQLPLQIDGVAPLITDPPPTNSTKKKFFDSLNMWHLTHDAWLVTCDTWHRGWWALCP